MSIQIRQRITVESVAPALVLAFEWAGTDEDRNQMDVLCAFVDMVQALDQAQEANHD